MVTHSVKTARKRRCTATLRAECMRAMRQAKAERRSWGNRPRSSRMGTQAARTESEAPIEQTASFIEASTPSDSDRASRTASQGLRVAYQVSSTPPASPLTNYRVPFPGGRAKLCKRPADTLNSYRFIPSEGSSHLLSLSLPSQACCFSLNLTLPTTPQRAGCARCVQRGSRRNHVL